MLSFNTVAHHFSFRHLSRIFLKDKFFNILAILGLSIGISISLILMLIVRYDLAYDKHYSKYENIYRLGARIKSSEVDYNSARSAQELSDIIREEYPEVTVTSLNRSNFCLLQISGNNGLNATSFKEEVFQTDSSYFYVFDHEFIAGSPYSCFHDNKGVVLTESKAKTYFADRDPLGAQITINGEPKVITGIIKDLPGNSHLKFNILTAGLEDRGWERENGRFISESYWSPNVFTYILLSEGHTPEIFIDRFEYVYTKNLKAFGDKIGGTYSPILERLDGIHFTSTLERDEPRGNFFNLLLLVSIGLGILVLSIINYTNLAAIKSFGRGSEIAIRKVFGSGRRAIVISLMVESVLYSFAALVISLCLVLVIIESTFLNEITQRNLHLDLLLDPLLALIAVGLTFAVGVLSGLYPALRLSNISSSEILKGRFKSKPSSHAFKRALIVIQFCLSIMAVTFALVMEEQLDYLKTKDVGFDMANVLVVPFYEPNAGNAITSFKEDVLKYHRVLSATTSTQSPGSVLGVETVLVETTTGMQAKQIKVLYAGDHYLETLGIPLKDGLDLPPASNVQAGPSFLVNEAAVEFLGWGDEVLGKTMQFAYAEKPGSVVGVVQDFHFESMFTRIEPIIIVRSEEGARLHLKIHSEDVANTIRFIGDRWSAYDFRFPLEYYFLGEYYSRQYLPHDKQYQLISILSGLSILIALLGLFGLSAFSAVERMREMGIRRVHGATGKGVTWLLYKEAAGMVLVSSLIIAPISYLVIESWLSNFPYPVPIDVWVFILVIAGALMLTFGVVLFNARKICRQKPVEVLKCE